MIFLVHWFYGANQIRKGSNNILWDCMSKFDISVRLLRASPFLVLSQPPFSAQAVQYETSSLKGKGRFLRYFNSLKGENMMCT